MTSLRTKGKSTVVWLLMGMLLLGLGGFGITNFSGTGTASIGSTVLSTVTNSPRSPDSAMATIVSRTSPSTARSVRRVGPQL